MVTWNFSIEARQIYYSSSTQCSTIYLSDEPIRNRARGSEPGTDMDRRKTVRLSRIHRFDVSMEFSYPSLHQQKTIYVREVCRIFQN